MDLNEEIDDIDWYVKKNLNFIFVNVIYSKDKCLRW